MAWPYQHTILKQNFDLTLHGERENLIMGEIQSLVKEKLASPMEDIFNEFCPGETVIQLDKIYLDLGVIDGDHLQRELVAAYCRALREYLEQSTAFRPNVKGYADTFSNETETTIKSLPVAAKIQQDLLYFLKEGHWPALSFCEKENYDELILHQLHNDPAFVAKLIELICENAVASVRFALQSSRSVKEMIRLQWMKKLNDQKRENLRVLIVLLEQSQPNSNVIIEYLPLLQINAILEQPATMVKWIQLLNNTSFLRFQQELEMMFKSGYIISHLSSTEFVGFWKDVLIQLHTQQKQDRSFEDEIFIEKISQQPVENNEEVTNEFSNDLINPESKQLTGNIESGSLDTQSNTEKLQHEPGSKNLSVIDKMLSSLIAKPKGKDSGLREKLSENNLFISNAGLVLLHPYLPGFFKAVGLVENGAFLNAFSAERAIHLLEYLVNNSEQPLEAGLVLNKIICGCPVDMPLLRFIDLSEQERTEARILLDAVITHWAALKNSSPEALQEAFLQRNGKLVDDAGIWQLRVETSGLDVLLGQLPWSISVIKLPWMKGYMIVDWT